MDRRQFEVTVDYEVGTSLDVTDATARRIEGALLDRNLYSRGEKPLYDRWRVAHRWRPGAPLAATPITRRSAASWKTTCPERRGAPTRSFATSTRASRILPGVTVRASSSGGITHGKPVQIEVTGTDQGQIVTAAYQVAQALKETPGTFAVELSARRAGLSFRPGSTASAPRSMA